MLRSVALHLLSLALLVSWSSAAELFPTASHGKGELRYIDSIPAVMLSGTPEEIGQQHAALLAKPSSDVLDFPKRMFTEIGMGFVYSLAAQAGKTLLLNAPPRYQQEIAATTKAAGLDAETLAVANTLLELRRIGCSTLIVEGAKSKTGAPLFGRNFDFPACGILDRYGLLFVVKPEGKHPFAAVGFPGLMGVVSGMNDQGLCVATLDVYESADGSSHFDPAGTPLMLVFRQLLEECTTVAEAESLLKRTHATTQANLAVCDRKQGAVFEITPKGVARRDAEGALLPCTNHFRTAGMKVDDQCWRYDRLQSVSEQPKLGVSDTQQALHRANQGDLTLQTMVFEPRELVLHLALGSPPSSGQPMHRLELGELFAPAH